MLYASISREYIDKELTGRRNRRQEGGRGFLSMLLLIRQENLSETETKKQKDSKFRLNFNCWSSTTMEPIILGGGECSDTAAIQEKIGQTSVRSALTWIPALSRGLDSMALQAPSNSVILWFYDFAKHTFTSYTSTTNAITCPL